MTDTITMEQPPGHVTPTDGVITTGTPVGTDFKAVAIGAGANLEALPAYFTDPLLGTGNLPGIAISAFNNRALRQGTFVASSLCLWVSGQINAYVPDDGDQVHWQSEFQNALSNFFLSLLPPGPDLGLYLPLAGGQMVGNITFQTGITTVLANNTYYQALDNGGQARGLIIKNSNNDITINDGTAAHVVIANVPAANNNYAWSGKNTAGTILPVIGLLSDNAIHIGSSATTDIYFDETSAVHHAGNFILANNRYVYGNDTGNTPRALLGVSTDNSAYIASGVTGNTNIYSGSGNWIYLRTPANALSTFVVNGYTYMNGRGRAYVPGGNDPFQVYADNGYYARTQYLVGGVRQWSAGCLNSGIYGISDDSGGAMRFQIDTAGTATFFNTCNINGSSTVGGNIQCNNSINANGNLSCSNTGFIYNQLQVWNSLVVNSGNGYFGGGTVYCGGVNTGGWVQGGYLYTTGNMQVDGNFHGNNDVSANTCTFNHIQDNGDISINGNCQINGNCNISTTGFSNNSFIVWNGAGYYYNNSVVVPEPDGNGYVGLGSAGWVGMFAFAYYVRSDQRDKTSITPVPNGCLEAVRRIEPQTYRLAEKIGGRGSAMTTDVASVAEANRPPPDPKIENDPVMIGRKIEMEKTRNRQYWGFVSQDVGRVMQEVGIEFGGHSVCDDCDTESLGVVDMLAVLWAAVRELSDEVKQLKAA